MKKYLNRQNKNPYLKEIKKGKYSIRVNNGRLFTRSTSFLNLMRDIICRDQSLSKKEAIKKLDNTILFYNKKVNYKDPIQIGEIFSYENENYILTIKNSGFDCIKTSEHCYHSIIRKLVKINKEKEQVTLDNGFTFLVNIGSFKLHQFVKLDTSTKKLEKNLDYVREIITFKKNPVILKFLSIIETKNSIKSLILENGSQYILNKQFTKGHIIAPSKEIVNKI